MDELREDENLGQEYDIHIREQLLCGPQLSNIKRAVAKMRDVKVNKNTDMY